MKDANFEAYARCTAVARSALPIILVRARVARLCVRREGYSSSHESSKSVSAPLPCGRAGKRLQGLPRIATAHVYFFPHAGRRTYSPHATHAMAVDHAPAHGARPSSPLPRWHFRPSPRDLASRGGSATEHSACDTASDSLPSLDDGEESSLKYLRRQAPHNDSWATGSGSHDLDLESSSFAEAKGFSVTTDRACEPLIPGARFVSVKECLPDRSECSEQSLLHLCSNTVVEPASTASKDGRPFEAPWFENSARNLGQWVNEDPSKPLSLNESLFSLRSLRAGDSRHVRGRESRKLPSALRAAGRSVSDVSARRRKASPASVKKSLSLFNHEGNDENRACDSSSLQNQRSHPYEKRRDARKDEKCPPPYATLSRTAVSESVSPRGVQTSASKERKPLLAKKGKRSKSIWNLACFEC